MGLESILAMLVGALGFMSEDDEGEPSGGFDAMVTARREDPSKSIRRGRYQLHLVRFTGESGWYRCDDVDFPRMEPGTCAHFEVREPNFIKNCTRWTQTPEQISQMLIEDKGD